MKRREVIAGAAAALVMSALPAVAALKDEYELPLKITNDGIYYDFYLYRGYEMKIAHEDVVRLNKCLLVDVATTVKNAIDAYLDQGKILEGRIHEISVNKPSESTWYKCNRYYAHVIGMPGPASVLVMMESTPIHVTDRHNLEWKPKRVY